MIILNINFLLKEGWFMLDVKKSLHKRVAAREQDLKDIFTRIYKLIEEDKIGDEENRVWAEDLIKKYKGSTAVGLDLFCGDFKLDGSVGVDGSPQTVGPDMILGGGFLPVVSPESQDYIFTNYLECVNNPLSVLNDWYRALKPNNGILVMALRDGGCTNPLLNKKRQNVFTKDTILYYLKRAGFNQYHVETGVPYTSMRVVAYKK